MQQATEPILKDLVLVGGGHSHAIALRMFAMNPLAGLRLTLITDSSHTPYSGMLPGHVAGFYSFDECHIDLRRLARFAQAQLYIDWAVGLDLGNHQVLCANRPPVAFDYLSIDVGSTPAAIAVPGAAQYAILAKPVAKLLQAWNQLVAQVASQPHVPLKVSIVGGGAGGVELAMNMQRRLQHVLKRTQQSPSNLEIHLFHAGAELLPSYNRWVSQRLQNILTQRGIKLHLQEYVSEVFPDKLSCESGLSVACDRIFWVTQAAAPSWIQASGLATDSQGFVLVDDTLQSVSHPQVFAAGDIATMRDHPRPKAGVFAVRQGKPLFENLQRLVLGKPLKLYKPQQRYLSLIGTGQESVEAIAPRSAIASWGPCGWQSPLLWRWKDHIDRKFMEKFNNLPEMSEVKGQASASSGKESPTTNNKQQTTNNKQQTTNNKQQTTNRMHCAGCGSKVGSTTLERVLQRLRGEQRLTERDDILVGLGTPDDAAVVQVPTGQLMVHTIDYFRALINDPYIFGQISTNHCLSDIFAMGATPQSALAVVSIPYAAAAKVEETLYQLLSGALHVLQQANAPLVGGHTTEGAELAFGLSCNGLLHPDQLLKKSGMKPGQVLILTKALGTGTLFAADMRHQAKSRWIDNAVHSMLLSNQEAASVFIEHGSTACTDVTGFGLLGHLGEMVQASGVAVVLELEAIPVLEGAFETVQRGIVSSLQAQNLGAARLICNLSDVECNPNYPLLFDPQTAGGLLATVPIDRAANCLAALKALGYTQSCVIGRVLPAEDEKPIAFAKCAEGIALNPKSKI